MDARARPARGRARAATDSSSASGRSGAALNAIYDVANNDGLGSIIAIAGEALEVDGDDEGDDGDDDGSEQPEGRGFFGL